MQNNLVKKEFLRAINTNQTICSNQSFSRFYFNSLEKQTISRKQKLESYYFWLSGYNNKGTENEKAIKLYLQKKQERKRLDELLITLNIKEWSCNRQSFGFPKGPNKRWFKYTYNGVDIEEM